MTEERVYKGDVEAITRENGKVKVDVYRAVLKPKKYEYPLFYTLSREQAERKAKWKKDRSGRPTEVLSYTLTFDNPLEIPVGGTYRAIEYLAGEKRIPALLEVLEDLDNAESDIERNELILEGQKELFDWATDVGYDGIITRTEVIDLENYEESMLWD